MQCVRGNNDFKGTFDLFEWSAKNYETPQRVLSALKRAEIEGKVIKQVTVIGYADPIPEGITIYDTVTSAGIELGEGWFERGSENEYAYLDKVRVPWKAEVCEPFRLLFTDGSTLEILPTGNGSARIAENSIPAEISDGLNPSNFDCEAFFAEAIGKTVENIEICAETKETSHYHTYRGDPRNVIESKESVTEYRLTFSLGNGYEIELSQSLISLYTVGMRSRDRGKTIPYARAIEALNENGRVTITSGVGHGGTFLIVPADLKGKNDFRVDCYCMSIEDYDVETYLGDLLRKYFDPKVQIPKENRYEGKEFDGNDLNYYTFDTIRRILDDVNALVDSLENGCAEPPGADRLYIYARDPMNGISDAEKDEIIERLRETAIDFYKRFSKRMTSMMSVPDCDAVVFAGP